VNVLLDTHIWLWSLLEPERLSAQVASTLSAGETRRWLSPLSVWEAHLLIERRRLVVDGPAAQWIREALTKAPVDEAPLTTDVALASRALATRHRDPVDRFLLATAQVFDLTLVTADRALFDVAGVRVLKNRRARRSSRHSGARRRVSL
jgi:PIN domain nuclease of toxin-antitoxin system